jgi:hypothetical protein
MCRPTSAAPDRKDAGRRPDRRGVRPAPATSRPVVVGRSSSFRGRADACAVWRPQLAGLSDLAGDVAVAHRPDVTGGSSRSPRPRAPARSPSSRAQRSAPRRRRSTARASRPGNAPRSHARPRPSGVPRGSGQLCRRNRSCAGGTPTHHEKPRGYQSDFLSNPVPGARGRRGSRACPARDAPAEVGSPEGAVEAPPVYILTPAFSQSSRKRLRPMSVSGCFRSIWNTAKGSVATSAPATAASTTCSGLRSDAARIWVSKS